MAVDGSNKNLKMLVFEQEVNEKLSNMENKYNISNVELIDKYSGQSVGMSSDSPS